MQDFRFSGGIAEDSSLVVCDCRGLPLFETFYSVFIFRARQSKETNLEDEDTVVDFELRYSGLLLLLLLLLLLCSEQW
jgi:hypothetical protein